MNAEHENMDAVYRLSLIVALEGLLPCARDTDADVFLRDSYDMIGLRVRAPGLGGL